MHPAVAERYPGIWRAALGLAIVTVLFATTPPGALGACGKTKANWPEAGASVRDFQFTDLAGHEHRLSDLAGHYVLLEFWGTWCEGCVYEIPVLKKARELYGSRGLEILGLDNDLNLEAVQDFVAKNQLPWLQAAPASTQQIIQEEIKIAWYPTLILLDPQHKILLVSGNSKTPLSPEQLLTELDRLLPPEAP